jgi:hypothetical protein
MVVEMITHHRSDKNDKSGDLQRWQKEGWVFGESIGDDKRTVASRSYMGIAGAMAEPTPGTEDLSGKYDV